MTEPSQAPKRLAVLVGNTRFGDGSGLGAIPAAEHDLAGMKTLLQSETCKHFEVRVLLNRETDHILAEIEQACKECNAAQDLLLVYFSTHGFLVGTDFHLAGRSSKSGQAAGALHGRQLQNVINRARCNNKILILDTCHAAAFPDFAKGEPINKRLVDYFTAMQRSMTLKPWLASLWGWRVAKVTGGPPVLPIRALRATPPAATLESQNDWPRGRGRYLLAASHEHESAFQGGVVSPDIPCSLFTHHLIEGIVKGYAARPHNLYIDVGSWFQYAQARVAQAHPQQTPMMRAEIVQAITIAKRPPLPFPQDDPAAMDTADGGAEAAAGLVTRGAGTHVQTREVSAFFEVLTGLKQSNQLLSEMSRSLSVSDRESLGKYDRYDKRVTKLKELRKFFQYCLNINTHHIGVDLDCEAQVDLEAFYSRTFAGRAPSRNPQTWIKKMHRVKAIEDQIRSIPLPDLHLPGYQSMALRLTVTLRHSSGVVFEGMLDLKARLVTGGHDDYEDTSFKLVQLP